MEVSFPSSMFDTRGLVQLGRLSAEDLAFYSWCRILATKLAFSVIMYLVADMSAYAKKEMRPKNIGIPYLLLSLSYIVILCLSPEMRRFVYSGIRR